MSKFPDYIVSVKKKGAKYGTRVGAAWKGEYGYSIKLDPGIAIFGGEDIYINLNTPRDRDSGSSGDTGRGNAFSDDVSDDIPF